MIKKITFLLLIALITVNSLIPSFAVDTDSMLVKKETKDTEEFMVTITRPEGDESTFKSSYVICGNTTKKDIRVKLYILDKETDKYTEFNINEAAKNGEHESYWDIGESGIFMKEIILPEIGTNTIRILAYNKNNEDNKENLKPGESIQINSYTITVLNKKVKDSIKNGLFRITDMLNKLFVYKSGGK
ncbi:MAG: hypothetical protein GX660_06615 [Clostridiaceae bacterium]|nr:hypothetical protein [Clostridiaceae bacterium]